MELSNYSGPEYVRKSPAALTIAERPVDENIFLKEVMEKL